MKTEHNVGSLILLAGSSQGYGDTVTLTYTGDDEITAWYQNGNDISTLLGPNKASWPNSDTININLNPGTYTFIFCVENGIFVDSTL